MLLALHLIAVSLEVAGILVSVKEYRDGLQRWNARFPPEAPEPLPLAGGRNRSGTGKASWSPKEPRDIQERVAALESRLNWQVRSLRNEVRRVAASVSTVADGAAAKVEERLTPTVGALIAYLSGQYEGDRPRWLPRWWIGPVLLVCGVAVSFVATLIGTLTR